MIKLNNLNKYYNNSLHVINNVTLELPDTGLVTFLGKSGCGKTTLLNVIGGNDAMDNGTIIYDSVEFKKYSPKTIDKYRQKNIGYIFQNYLLIEDMSVYDNLKEQLEIIGIFDKEEQKARIEYALKVVGLYKYRKKSANRLSGGEQQRVSIARSLVKKSKLIIADEPTGNLDSQNSIEIMNILKQISKSTLVLLVTHNEDLANAYSDRIIRLKDGRVVADGVNENNSNEVQTTNNEKDIHLLDYVKLDVMSNDCDINVYKDKSDIAINLRIVVKNNTLYIDTDNKVVLTKDARINILEDHYHEVKKIEITEAHFDNSFYDDTKKGKNKNLKIIGNSIRSFFHSTKKQRAFRLVFFVIGCIIAGLATSLSNVLTIDDSKISNEDVKVFYSNDIYYYGYINPKDVQKALDEGIIEDFYINEVGKVYCHYSLNSKRTKTYEFELFNYPYSRCEGYDLLAGTEPNGNGVVIGKDIADGMLKKFNLESYESLVGCKLVREYGAGEYNVCGVTSKPTNSTYFHDAFSNYIKYGKYDSLNLNIYDISCTNYTLIEGKAPTDGEVLISNKTKKLGYNIGDKIPDLGVISGVFNHINEYQDYEFISGDTVNEYGVIRYYVISEYGNFIQFIHKDNLITKIAGYESVKDGIKLVSGKAPTAKDEIIIPVGINENIYGGYTVVGRYILKSNSAPITLIGTDEYMLDQLLTDNFTYSRITYKVKDGVESYYNYKISDLKDYVVDYTVRDNRESQIGIIIPTLIFLGIIMVYVYFTTQARLLNNIKNVGILRSIGATKAQIMKTYAIDTIVETTFTSLLGYLIVAAVNIFVRVKFAIISNSIVNSTTILVLVAFGILVFVINLIFGLLPVIRLLKKTPSEIISKYDI